MVRSMRGYLTPAAATLDDNFEKPIEPEFEQGEVDPENKKRNQESSIMTMITPLLPSMHGPQI